MIQTLIEVISDCVNFPIKNNFQIFTIKILKIAQQFYKVSVVVIVVVFKESPFSRF